MSQKLNVLILDDEPVYLQNFLDAIEDCSLVTSHQFVMVQSSKFQLPENIHDYNVIFLDKTMPVDGSVLLEKLLAMDYKGVIIANTNRCWYPQGVFRTFQDKARGNYKQIHALLGEVYQELQNRSL